MLLCLPVAAFAQAAIGGAVRDASGGVLTWFPRTTKMFAEVHSETSPRSLRLDRSCSDHLAHHITMLEEVFRRAGDFDIIHFHVDYLHFPWSRRMVRPQVTTLHGRLDIADLLPLYREFRDMPASTRGCN